MQANPGSETIRDFEFDALRGAENYRRALINIFNKTLKGKVIEIGSGIGQMSGLLGDLADIKFLQCVEPDPAFCKKLVEDYPDQPLICGTIKDVPDNDWNGIISVNVLEHISDDESELRMYYERLKLNHGKLNLFVPARQEIYGEIDKDFGHFRRYSMKEIRSKLEKAGFKIEILRYYNLIGYFAWWFNFSFLKKRTFETRAVKFFDRFIFPIGHTLEYTLFPPPVGQSLVIVAYAA